MAVKLTIPFVDNAKSDDGKRREIGDALVPGLWLVVQPSGAKSWAVRYRADGKPVKVTLGPYPLIGLADAREQGREVLEKVAKGENPAAEKRETRAIKFSAPVINPDRDLWRTVLADYLKRDAAGLRSFEAVKRLLEKETAGWLERRIQDIGKRDVVEMLDAVTDRGAKVQANRVLAHVRRVFNWAKGRDIVTTNPTEGLEKPAQEVSRDRVLAPAEVRDIWRAADALGYPFGPMVKLLFLTGQRLREVAEARWNEVDVDRQVWTIDPARAKNAERHDVPLTAPAIALFESLPRISKSPYILTTSGTSPISGFARAKERIDALLRELDIERAGRGVRPSEVPERQRWTFHDIRRTVATNMAAGGVLIEVIERVLNHKGSTNSGLRKVYNRFSYMDEKRQALEAWAQRLDLMTSDEVVQ